MRDILAVRIDQLLYARQREWSGLFTHDKQKLFKLIMAECEDLEKEKQRRIYYQNIVFNVCGQLDDAMGNHISRGTGIVCGTVDRPTTEVQDSLKKVIKKLRSNPNE